MAQNEEGIPSFQDAVEAAMSELDLAEEESVEAAPVTADGGDQAEEAKTDQADSGKPEAVVDSVFDSELLDELEAQAADETDMDAEVTLPGHDKPVTQRELVDGYLRQSDYTQKTQELAESRKQLDADNGLATRLMEKLRDAPLETVAALAVEVGLLEPDQVDQSVLSQLDEEFRVPTQDQIQKEIKAGIDSAVEAHPLVVEAQQEVFKQKIKAEFGEIEKQIGQTLSARDRNAVMQKALEIETPRLDVAFATLMREADLRRNQREDLEAAAPVRPTGGDSGAEPITPDAPPTSIRGLWEGLESGSVT